MPILSFDAPSPVQAQVLPRPGSKREKKELITSDGQKLLNMVKLYLKFLGSKKATNTQGEAAEQFTQRKVK